MTIQLNPRLVFSFRAFSKYTSIAVIVVGSLALFGWIFDVPALKSVTPGLATMKANTAIAFIVAGVSVFLESNEGPSRRAHLVARGCAIGVALLGLLTLGETISGADFGIDQWIFARQPTYADPYPGRMSIIGAVNFILVGLALLLLDIKIRHDTYPAQWLALAAGSLAFLALVGYLYGVESLYSVGSYSSIALHSALNFTLLSFAILCARPDRGLMRIVSSDTVGGILLRRLVPVAILMPVVLGWLRLLGERAGLYDTTFGVVLLVVSMIALLGVTIWLNAGSLNNLDVNRQQAEACFRLVVEAAHNAMIMVDARGKIQFANVHVREMFGYRTEELIGKSVELLIPERFRSKHPGFRQGYLADSRARAMGVGRDLFGVRKDGREIPIEIGLNPVQTQGGLFTLAAIIDITERKKIEAEMKRSFDELERSNMELEQVAYVASHDLQEPLRMVSSYVQLLARRYQGKLDSDADEFIAFAVEGANRMKVLINDLLAFSRVGTRGKELAPVMLEEIFEHAVHNLQLTIEESGATVTHDQLPQVMADDGQMLQLIQNLVGNALKFHSEEPPKVHVGARREKDRWLLFVRDNGIGIDSQCWERIFVIFQRLHNREEYQGTGIVLAIARKIVERHGGQIWVESKPDQGSTFFFTLPPGDQALLVEAPGAPLEAKQVT